MATHFSSRSPGLPTWHDNCVIITLDRSEIIKYERREGDGGKFQRRKGEEEAEDEKRKGRGEGGEDEEELVKMEEMIMQKYVFKYSQYTLFSSEKYQWKITRFKYNAKYRY